MNKKAIFIITIQALLIVVLFWLFIFYAQDEYEDFRTEQKEEIEGIDRVTENDGISIINLSTAVQKNSGIRTTKVDTTQFSGEIKSFGNVVALDTLTDARADYLTLQTELRAVNQSNKQNLIQYKKLKILNADDKNVSDRAVQEAFVLVNANQAKINALTLQIRNLRNSTLSVWGEKLSKLAFSQELGPQLQGLLKRNRVLVRASLPHGIPKPKTGDTITISALNNTNEPITAQYISAATQADTNGLGKTFNYSAPSESLRLGMRVNVELTGVKQENSNGVIIPSDAVVWYAGEPWAYFKEGDAQFVRKPISADTELDTGWFNQNISEDSQVVISGAQLLLSEEFKYLIKNENED